MSSSRNQVLLIPLHCRSAFSLCAGRRDYQSSGMIRDDDLYDILIKGLPAGVHMLSLMDCCHSGSFSRPFVSPGSTP